MSENERLEAVAKALFDLDGNWDALIACSEDPDPAFDEARFLAKVTREQAAAALAAGDQYGIEAALDGVHQQASFKVEGMGRNADQPWRATVYFWKHDDGGMWSMAEEAGTGPTRTAAILNACERAKTP